MQIDVAKIIESYNEATRIQKELREAFEKERDRTPKIHGIKTITVRIRGSAGI